MPITLKKIEQSHKVGLVLLIGTVILASIMYFWQLNHFPLVDYDESTYAQVTRDTLASGDVLTLKRFEEPDLPQQVTKAPVRLIVRESTGPVRQI